MKSRVLALFSTLIMFVVIAPLTSGEVFAQNDVPPHKAQAPGYYRMMVGNYEVTALLDGTHPFLADELLVGIPQAQVDSMLALNYQKSPVEGAINAFLINTGSKLILFDTGAGELYGKDGGLLLGNLRASGYQPEQVSEVFLTHLHRDHVGGLLLKGKMIYPNAVIHVSQVDADFWLNSANKAKVPKILWPMFDGAIDSLKPYIAAGKFKPFDADGELEPGIVAIAAPGHSPGHTVYKITSAGQTLMVWGDIVHVAPVQFPEPSASIKYDINGVAAVQSRERIFKEAAAQGYWIAAAHVSFPGIGHVHANTNGNGYIWVPTNYGLMRAAFAMPAQAATPQD